MQLFLHSLLSRIKNMVSMRFLFQLETKTITLSLGYRLEKLVPNMGITVKIMAILFWKIIKFLEEICWWNIQKSPILENIKEEVMRRYHTLLCLWSDQEFPLVAITDSLKLVLLLLDMRFIEHNLKMI